MKLIRMALKCIFFLKTRKHRAKSGYFASTSPIGLWKLMGVPPPAPLCDMLELHQLVWYTPPQLRHFSSKEFYLLVLIEHLPLTKFWLDACLSDQWSSGESICY